MKHAGEARSAGLKIILWTLIAIGVIGVSGFLAVYFGQFLQFAAVGLFFLWILFALFTLYFFRDPTPRVSAAARAVVSPAHGKVDVIDEVTEAQILGGPCHRVSIFLSVFDVHVQNAPVAGKIFLLQHTNGQFLNAIRADCALYNENVLVGFDSAEIPGEKIAVRLIAGLIARRIVPYVKVGDALERGERLSLIQFGSRVDLYLPLDYKILVKLGDRVVGGETLMASKP